MRGVVTITRVQSETEKFADNDLKSFEPAWGFSFFKTGLKTDLLEYRIVQKKNRPPPPLVMKSHF